jgi:hypothetical protein
MPVIVMVDKARINPRSRIVRATQPARACVPVARTGSALKKTSLAISAEKQARHPATISCSLRLRGQRVPLRDRMYAAQQLRENL